jgi:CubicO group peptidase (beta-lactamase class C family)
LALLAALAAAQPALEGKLDERTSALLKASGAPSVSVAVVENNRVTYVKAFGKADVERNRDASPDTRYAAGSISKQFTAAALLLAGEQGKLSLDDKVSKFLPELTRASEVSIRQLLSHTSGYEDFAPQDYIIPEWTKPTTAKAVMERWGKKPLNFDPGTRWQYSNTGYVIAGAIFEKATGKALVDFLRERIFKPLGMKTAGDCDERNAADATAYTRYALGPPRTVAREGAGWYFAAGELCMTAGDLAKWNAAFLGRKILSPGSWAQFTREVRLADGRSTHYALGLTVREQNGAIAYSHGGEVSGFLAENIIIPSKGFAVTVFSNADNTNLTTQLADQIAAMAFGEQTAASPGERAQVKAMIESFQHGRIDRGLFSENANSYFSAMALEDFQTSLEPLGAVKELVRTNESLRGGMTHRSYRARLERGAVRLNIYVLPDGKYEQFLVSQQN